MRQLEAIDLETVCGGLSVQLRQAATAVANERWMNALDYNSAKAPKFERQMQLFQPNVVK